MTDCPTCHSKRGLLRRDESSYTPCPACPAGIARAAAHDTPAPAWSPTRYDEVQF